MLVSMLAFAALVPGSPIPHHYRLDIKATRQYERERSATDTATLGGDFTVTAFLSTTARDTSGGQVGHVVIDSVTCSGTGLLSMAYDPAVGRASKGVWYDVVLSRVAPAVVPAPSMRNPLTDVIGQFATALFAPERSDPRMGDVWSDTLDLRSTTENYAQSGPTVTRWKVVAANSDSTVLGGTITGVVAVSGRIMATGMILGTRSVALSSAGVVRSASISTTQQMLLANQGATVPRTGHGSTSAEIRLLP